MKLLFSLLATTSAAALLLSTVADARTRVAVLEFGPSGSVRRTTSNNVETTPQGVHAFWQGLHPNSNRRNRVLQPAGLTVVPDLFQQPSAGVVIGLNQEKNQKMPYVASLLDTQQEKNGVVGHLQVASPLATLLNPIDTEQVAPAQLEQQTKHHCQHKQEKSLSALQVVTTEEDKGNTVDSTVKQVLKKLQAQAEQSGETIVVHLVVEDDDDEQDNSASRPQHGRRLDENNNGNQDNNQDGNGDNQQSDYFYGTGYYDEYGKYITQYKSMFQIQYFQIVLWTSIGLVVTIFFVIYLMVNMPLEPDTLLFGESARMPGED